MTINNTLLTPQMITRKSLMILHQKANFLGSINKQYSDEFAQKGAKIGTTLNVRLPNQYVVRTGATLNAQNTVETDVPLQLSNQMGVDLNFTSADLTLSLDDFAERIIDPAMAVLAANIESTVITNLVPTVYNSIWNVGSAGSYNQQLSGRVILNRTLTPMTKRTANLNSQDMADLVTDTKTLFNDDKSIGEQYTEGYMGRAAGFDFMENQNWGTFTRSAASGYLVSGASQTGATLTVGTGTGTPNAGEVITIAGVYSVNPETKLSTGVLQQFVLQSGSTTTSFKISPAIVTSGAAQNVSGSPANSAAITFAGTASTSTGVSMQYQRDAFTFATADLIMPKGVDFAAREVMDGVSMRIVRQFDIVNDAFPCRLDVLFGYAALRPQLACRLHNH